MLAFPVQEFLRGNFYTLLWNVLSRQSAANLIIDLEFLVHLLSYTTNYAGYYLAFLPPIAPLLKDQLC